MMHYQQMTPQCLLSSAWAETPRSQRLSLVHSAFIIKREADTASTGVLIGGISIPSGKHFTMSLASCSLPEHASWPLCDSNGSDSEAEVRASPALGRHSLTSIFCFLTGI
jgi:hypothetical protein